jgi:hypothetical protein
MNCLLSGLQSGQPCFCSILVVPKGKINGKLVKLSFILAIILLVCIHTSFSYFYLFILIFLVYFLYTSLLHGLCPFVLLMNLFTLFSFSFFKKKSVCTLLVR